MQKRTREILAVLLLGLLVLAGVCAMGYYIFIGHNWNVAASNIDDSIGRMDGYTVVLYEGTRPLEYELEKDAPFKFDTPRGIEAEEDAVINASLGIPDQSVEADMVGVVRSYRDKNANVFVVDAGDLARYSDPFVVAKNGMRMGFFSVGKATRRSAARADAQNLAENEVNYTIALTNDPTLYRVAQEGLIGAVSIIVCDDKQGQFPNGRYCGSTFCVSTPHVGEVGAIIISPSGVLSSKVLDGWQDA